MDKRIGWIGLGRMGEAMAKRLIKAGHKVSVWNRTASKAAPLAEYGATIVATKQDLASCDIVFTMVSTTDDLKEVLFGEGGLVAGSTKPRVVVDSSSISQEGSAEIRQRLPHASQVIVLNDAMGALRAGTPDGDVRVPISSWQAMNCASLEPNGSWRASSTDTRVYTAQRLRSGMDA